MNLRTPGPIPVPPEVVEAGTADMIDHRGPEFDALIGSVTAGLKHIYRTENDVLTAQRLGNRRHGGRDRQPREPR